VVRITHRDRSPRLAGGDALAELLERLGLVFVATGQQVGVRLVLDELHDRREADDDVRLADRALARGVRYSGFPGPTPTA